jgi:atypical dual specificity phosphatase
VDQGIERIARVKFDWIEPGILAGSGTPVNREDIQSLKAQGIAAIVSLTEQPLSVKSGITSQLFEQLDIKYLFAPIPDGQPPDRERAVEILELIDEMTAQGRATLVHCAAGMGRTGTLLHTYFLGHGLSLDEARKKVKATRPTCNFLGLSESQREFLTRFVPDKI